KNLMLYAILLANGIAAGLLYGLIGLGFSLVFRTAGLLNFSIGELVMFGGMLGFTALAVIGLPLVPAMLLVMVAVGLLAALSELLVFRPIRARGGRDLNSVIASVGLLLILMQSGLRIWGAEPLSYPRQFAAQPVQLGPFLFPSQV